jgi:hypothetical protein
MQKIIEYHRNELKRYQKMGDSYNCLRQTHIDCLEEIETSLDDWPMD